MSTLKVDNIENLSGDSIGVWTLIQANDLSASVSSVDFTTGIDSTYDTYMLIGSGVHGSGATDISIQGYINGAFQSSNYMVIMQRIIRTTTSVNNQDTTNYTDCLSAAYLNTNGGSNQGVDFKVIISNPSSTAYHTQAMGEWWGEDSGPNLIYNNCCGVYRGGNQAMTGIRLRMRNGVSFTGHKVALYGLKYS